MDKLQGKTDKQRKASFLLLSIGIIGTFICMFALLIYNLITYGI